VTTAVHVSGPSRRHAPSAVVLLAAVACALALALSSPAGAQPAVRVHRIGVLDSVPMTENGANLAAFGEGLAQLGYVVGRNVVIEYRSADGRTERFPALAAGLLALGVDVIVTRGTPAALAARHATTTVPIVMASVGHPVFDGLVKSLARPGGNVTGLHAMAPPDLAATRLRLLRELLPGLSRVGVVLDSGDMYAALAMSDIEKAGQAMGVRVHGLDVRSGADLGRILEIALLDGVEALIAVEGPVTVHDLPRVVEAAAISRLPAVYGLREFVDAGGLMAYGTDRRDLFRRAAGYVHRILQGASPADLPIEPPARFELAINLRTARTLGLTVPPSLLRRADHVVR
jgi:putative ABC transport system substrate-binding protein